MRMTDTINGLIIGMKHPSVGGHSNLLNESSEKLKEILDKTTDEQLKQLQSKR